MKLEELEAEVLERLLAGEHPVLASLREQVPHLTVAARKKTGAGFFTEFALTEGATPAKVPSPKIRFGDVAAELPGLQYGAGFVLYIDNGFLRMLEGYSYDEPWPEGPSEFSIRYLDPSRRQVRDTFGPT